MMSSCFVMRGMSNIVSTVNAFRRHNNEAVKLTYNSAIFKLSNIGTGLRAPQLADRLHVRSTKTRDLQQRSWELS